VIVWKLRLAKITPAGRDAAGLGAVLWLADSREDVYIPEIKLPFAEHLGVLENI